MLYMIITNSLTFKTSYFILIWFAVFFVGCEKESPVAMELKDALTFYASFDEGFSADYARGDGKLYTAASWDLESGASEVTGMEGLVTRLSEGGREGGALRFSTDWNPVVFFRAKDNVQFAENNWAGSFSFWLRVDPVNGLAEGYSDPFIVTDKNWDNASFYVDFTEEQPRHFRFAAFSDYEAWNPAGVPWESFPVENRPMIDLTVHPFNTDKWTHVVLTFEAVNAEAGAGVMKGYVNGDYRGMLGPGALTMHWNPEKVLMGLGRHYNGDFDDLAVFNRALSPEEIKALYLSPLIDLF